MLFEVFEKFTSAWLSKFHEKLLLLINNLHKNVRDNCSFTLTSHIGKVMEGFTLDSLLGEVSSKLDTKQFAMPRKSTTQALVCLLHLIHAGLDVGHCYARLFFADFRKGFDLVDYNFIIGELRNLQVHPVIISAKLAMASSSWKKVNGGLPQGTKLGPILFAILTNSLLQDLKGAGKVL